MSQWREKIIILGGLVIVALLVMVRDVHENKQGNIVLPSPEMVVVTPSPSPLTSPLIFSVRGGRDEED